MARLTESDKKSHKDLTRKGWIQTKTERSPVFVEPNPENNEAYCRWVSDVSKFLPPKDSAQFTGSDWKL